MQISPSEANIALAGSVRNRLRADGAIITAKAWMWRSIGLGTMALMVGGGVGLVFYGYSYVTDSRTSADKMAAAFAAALDHANLGTVRLDPQSSVTLAKGGTVALEPGGTVSISPNVVRLETDALPRPTDHQLHGDPVVANQPTGKIVTNFTIFKTVPFGSGWINTGWNFASSEQQTPSDQFCHYRKNNVQEAGTSTVVALAFNGEMVPTAKTNTEINGIAAAAQCVWFNGQPTVTGIAAPNKSELWGK